MSILEEFCPEKHKLCASVVKIFYAIALLVLQPLLIGDLGVEGIAQAVADEIDAEDGHAD